MPHRRRQSGTPFRDRCIYAVGGGLSGGFLAFVACLLIWSLIARLTGEAEGTLWLLVVGPAVFGGVMGLWGFIAPESMLDQLEAWWSHFTGSR